LEFCENETNPNFRACKKEAWNVNNQVTHYLPTSMANVNTTSTFDKHGSTSSDISTLLTPGVLIGLQLNKKTATEKCKPSNICASKSLHAILKIC
jgi:hypothetical protein